MEYANFAIVIALLVLVGICFYIGFAGASSPKHSDEPSSGDHDLARLAVASAQRIRNASGQLNPLLEKLKTGLKNHSTLRTIACTVSSSLDLGATKSIAEYANPSMANRDADKIATDLAIVTASLIVVTYDSVDLASTLKGGGIAKDVFAVYKRVNSWTKYLGDELDWLLRMLIAGEYSLQSKFEKMKKWNAAEYFKLSLVFLVRLLRVFGYLLLDDQTASGKAVPMDDLRAAALGTGVETLKTLIRKVFPECDKKSEFSSMRW